MSCFASAIVSYFFFSHSSFNLPQKHSIGALSQQSPFFAKFGIINMRKIFQEANAILEKWGMPQVPLGKNAKHMNVEVRKIVEIARALSTDPDILILDEVTQALAQDNRKKLHALIENFKSMGRSVILITHDLEEMMEICDTISILRDGELIETVES